MKRVFSIILFSICLVNFSFSQSKFVIQNKKGSDKVRFNFINNLIIIPVEINGVELSFLLDTGVSKPIIFNLINIDTLKIKNTERIYIRGLGEGESVPALKSTNNVVKIGDAIKLNQDLFAVYDTNLNFAPRLGIPVHGIIGFDLLKDLIVEVNYSNKYIKLSEPDKYKYKKCRKCEKLYLEFYNNKPYINAEVSIDNKKVPVKLLIDSGGSDALWLFEDDSLGIKSTKKYFNDFLGHGLSGSVYGKRSIIDEFSLNSFNLKNANVAYPDSASIIRAKQFKNRNGSLSGNILKRFNVIFDYQKARVTLKKNAYFREKFTYNKSGIELAHNGVRLVREREKIDDKNERGAFGENNPNSNSATLVFDTRYKLSLKPAYTIVELREGSPAYRAGLKLDDVILSINGKPAHSYNLQGLIYKFYGKTGDKIRLKVERDGVELSFNFELEDIFQ